MKFMKTGRKGVRSPDYKKRQANDVKNELGEPRLPGERVVPSDAVSGVMIGGSGKRLMEDTLGMPSPGVKNQRPLFDGKEGG